MEQKSDYEVRKQAVDEAAGTIEFLKQVYPTLGNRSFFEQATLRSLAAIIKLLMVLVSRG